MAIIRVKRGSTTPTTSNMSYLGELAFDYSNEALYARGVSSVIKIGGELEKVYSYEPIPNELTAEEAKYVLGVQTNLWTEYVATTQKAEYMLLPRLQAQAEVAWTNKDLKDLQDFKKRLDVDYVRLKKLGINFRDHKK